MCMLSTIGREFIVHWATRPPYKLKLQHLRAKWPPDLMLSRVQIKSFHASLKKECVYPVPVFEDYETAAAVLFEYVHAFYNRKRIHSSLGYQTPYKLKLQHLRAKWPPDLMLSRVQISY
ncbi:IS3 family transposase [Pediococcus pentosaceus]|uniref:IS3 family transposase n=1 Tax=Pediococcus pentosaceus TaxID=1255 RepID=UPI0034E943AA